MASHVEEMPTGYLIEKGKAISGDIVWLEGLTGIVRLDAPGLDDLLIQAKAIVCEIETWRLWDPHDRCNTKGYCNLIPACSAGQST